MQRLLLAGVLTCTLETTVLASGMGSKFEATDKDSNWTFVTNQFLDVAIGANGKMWALDRNISGGGNRVHEFINGKWVDAGGQGLKLAVDPTGHAWTITANYDIWRSKDGGGWERMPGLATDIAISSAGEVYVLGIGYGDVGGGFVIWRWNGSSYNTVPGSAVRIAVAPDGTLWALRQDLTIAKRVNGQWTSVTGLAREIAIGPTGDIYVTGSSPSGNGYGIFHWIGDNWTQLPGGATKIAVAPNGAPWIVTNNGEMYRGSPFDTN